MHLIPMQKLLNVAIVLLFLIIHYPHTYHPPDPPLGARPTALQCLQHPYFTRYNFVDVHRTCPLRDELGDEFVAAFVAECCGGV
jgi:hypothetical protein